MMATQQTGRSNVGEIASHNDNHDNRFRTETTESTSYKDRRLEDANTSLPTTAWSGDTLNSNAQKYKEWTLTSEKDTQKRMRTPNRNELSNDVETTLQTPTWPPRPLYMKNQMKDEHKQRCSPTRVSSISSKHAWSPQNLRHYCEKRRVTSLNQKKEVWSPQNLRPHCEQLLKSRNKPPFDA